MRRQMMVLGAAVILGACGSEGQGDAEVGVATAPEGTDVWVAELTYDEAEHFTLGELVNVTNRPGYDNQPHFLPDGSGLWYTRSDDAGHADIWLWTAATGALSAVTTSAPESEYSATPLPDGSGFSVIRMEADSAQRLWRFDADGGNAAVLLPDLAPVGYQAWSGDHTLALFVLGTPATLQVADVNTGATQVIAQGIGRSIQQIPGSMDVSYVQQVEGGTEIRRLNPATGQSQMIAPGIGGGDYHAWTPDGVLLQADGGRLMEWRPDHPMWMPVADYTARGLQLSRLAVSPDGTRIALVAEAAGN